MSGDFLMNFPLQDILPIVTKPQAFYLRNEEEMVHPDLNNDGNLSVEVLTPKQRTVTSLTCPLSFKRQVKPVRTMKCKHLQTFDMMSFLDIISSTFKRRSMEEVLKSEHKCPVCCLKGPLYVDSKVLNLLECFPHASHFSVTQDGDLHPTEDLRHGDCLPYSSCSGQSSSISRRFSFGGFKSTVKKGRLRRLSTIDLTQSPCGLIAFSKNPFKYGRLPTIDLTDSP